MKKETDISNETAYILSKKMKDLCSIIDSIVKEKGILVGLSTCVSLCALLIHPFLDEERELLTDLVDLIKTKLLIIEKQSKKNWDIFQEHQTLN